jgi:transposase
LKRFAASGLSWPLSDEITDAVLESQMYRSRGHRQYAEPDWAWIHRELKLSHVTLSILSDE